MNPTLRLMIAAACFSPLSVLAEVSLYGRANLTYSQNEEGDKSALNLESNASRIGFKGSEKLADEGIEAIYQAEYEAAFDDGKNDDTNKSSTFSQRNIYVGLKGGFGSVVGGHFDTPLKKIQNKVDLFNDLRGDIKNSISANEKRMSNSIMYTTNKIEGFTGYVDVINSEVPGVDGAQSVAVSFENGGIYAALAYDHNVRTLDAYSSTKSDAGTSAVRLVGQYTIDAWQLGFLMDHDANDKTATTAETDTTGYMASLQYSSGKCALKGEVGKSDNVKGRHDALAYSLGADYNFSKNTKVFGFYTNDSADEITEAQATLDDPKQSETDNSYLGVGLEMNF